jgi:DNA-binding MarR family transcriptional regulator
MNATAVQLNDLSKTVRACFQRLKAIGEHLHEDLDVTVAMRAVLETLVEDGPLTVPQIARRKAVTRQHIQTIVDALLAKKLVKLDDNPAHRRSPLIVATAKGSDLFADMRRREQHTLTVIGRNLDHADIGAALRTLAALNNVLESQLKETKHAA